VKEILLRKFLRSKVRLQQLNMILLIERHGSIHKVAEIMGLTQPAVTKSLKELENLVGFALFLREPRGLRSTPLCQPLLRAARETIAGVGGALATMARMQDGNAGQVSIGVVGTHALQLVVLSVAALHAGHPELRVLLNTMDRVAQLSELADDRLDIVVTPLPARLPDSPGLVVLPLGMAESLVVVARLGEGGQPSMLSLEQAVLELTWVLPPRPDPIRQSVDAAFLECGMRAPHRLIESQQPELMLFHPRPDALAAVVEASVADAFIDRGWQRILGEALRFAAPPPLALLTRAPARPEPALRIAVETLVATAGFGIAEWRLDPS